MTKNAAHCLLFATCPTSASAQLIAYTLVEQQLVAGVSLLPNLHSVYRWQGEIKNHAEIGLIMRTRVAHFTKIQEIFTTLHPYQVPELIMLPIEQGAENYLAWIDASCPL
ncbi:MAG: divalent-cation tolerance protein CutA [Thiotrichaceae bacterium]